MPPAADNVQYARAPQIAWVEERNGTVCAIDLAQRDPQMQRLNTAAAAVWRALDHAGTAQAVADGIATELPERPTGLETQVAHCLQELAGLGFVTEVG